MTAGRPRKFDYDKEADDLLKWAQLPSSINILGFCNPKDFGYEEMIYMASVSDKFFSSLKKAKQILSVRREERLDQKLLNYGIWERYADVYDPMLCEHEERKEKRRQSTGNQNQPIHIHVSKDGLASGSDIQTTTLSATHS